jgi:hypothetical protein
MPDVVDMIGEACPFCGSINLTVEQTRTGQFAWYVFCIDCFASGPMMVDRLRAIEMWNGWQIKKSVMKFVRVGMGVDHLALN